ncbi:MAG: ATP-binding protein [Bilophila wadsworthia]
MNKAALTLLGMEAPAKGKAILGRKPAEVLPSALAELAAKLLQEPVLPDTEIILRHGEEQQYISVRGGHVNEGYEGRLGSLMFLRDLTEVRRLEAEVRRREKLAAVGNLAAGVAHELRNPLSSIKGYATYFGGRFPEGSADREAAQVMVKEVERLNRAIGDLIGLSRPTDIRPRMTGMRRLIGDTLRLIGQDAANHKVAIRFDAPEVLPDVAIDPDRMRQVILNLCLNGLEAMPDGGELFLSLHPEPDALRLEIRDTGVGIAPDALPHIFDPYFTTKGQGTGLGLATVHKIMEAHGGSISVTSEPGQGAVFRLLLPLGGEGGKVHGHE